MCTFNFSTTDTFPGTLLYALITSYPFSIIGIACNFWWRALTSYCSLLPEIHMGRTLRAFSVGISAAGTQWVLNVSVAWASEWGCLSKDKTINCLPGVIWSVLGHTLLPPTISLVRSHKGFSHLKLQDHWEAGCSHIPERNGKLFIRPQVLSLFSFPPPPFALPKWKLETPLNSCSPLLSQWVDLNTPPPSSVSVLEIQSEWSSSHLPL